MNLFEKDSYEDMGFAKLDMTRENRTGTSEAIYCAGKTKEQLLKIFESFHQNKCSVLGTRCDKEKAEYVLSKMDGDVLYDETSRILSMRLNEISKDDAKCKQISKQIAVCCAGTADLPVAEEAAQTAEFYGANVCRHYDVGVAGIHRLLSKIEDIRKAHVVIAVAGMEGALAGVIAGLVKAPVIAVPTAGGYVASFEGIAPLLTMLNSCAEGVSVVNIDNGFGAAICACRILKLK